MFLMIGNGRMVRHCSHYFDLLNLPYLQWARSLHSEADLAQKLTQCSHVLVLISDDAIEAFVRAHPQLQQKTCVHFSGCLSTPLCHSAHPLMTFASDLYTLAEYQKIPFVIEAGGPEFEVLLPGVPNPSYQLKSDDKPLYHALCVMSGNFTVILWQHCLAQMQQKLGLPKAILMPYMQRIFTNLLNAPEAALTGPLARGNRATLLANQHALTGDPFQQVYAAFVAAYNATTPNKETTNDHS